MDTRPILDELYDYIGKQSNKDPSVLFGIYRELGGIFLDLKLTQEAKKIFIKSYTLSTEIQDSLQISFDLMNRGTVYQLEKKIDSALYYTTEALPYLLKINDSLNISYNYNNLAQAYKKKDDYQSAIKYYLMADSMIPNQNKLKSKIIFYENISDLYDKSGNYKLAYKYTKKQKELEKIVNDEAQNQALIDAETKYQTAQKENQLLISEQKKKQNQNIAIGLGGGMIGVALIGFLLFKNTHRKQHIAEQQREIEIRKTEKLLKDQELTIIDAMIAGQEKEREQLADDLHDSVGATLAAAKLQFNHLKSNKGKLKNEDELFEKTSTLLENAYTEIRAMAHLKNSGVLAKNGLLPAVEKLARNASGTNNLTVEVQDFGLDERLENSLEIMMFRVIQELVTNIIKHSKATEASISITQHKDLLSIIVEDNGQSFDTKKMHTKDGMGLVNIERRVEHQEGSMEVDSTKGKGTTVLIDIPI